ncbi:hypothetical protein AB0B66_11720 [Catellatospora sp. NPDC049111]|uniref:competence protein CoiA n=1 Tax=Catellatospora sp. NPDC049111 TaxID=3155271 RepID=UPI0033E30989
MPLVALGLGGSLDATQADLGRGVSWHDVYRVRPRAELTCPACSGAVHAKVSRLGLRFFAHDSAGRPCPLNGETIEHRLLKSAVAAAVRLAGWHARLEAAAPDGAWRADVLATSPTGDRAVAWEVQLAHQHDADTADRTARYALDRVEVVWIFMRPASAGVPNVVVEADGHDLTVAGPVARFAATRCDTAKPCVRLRDLADPPACPGHGVWEAATLPLDKFVALVCRDAITWTGDGAPPPPVAHEPEHPPAHVWTSSYYLRQADAIAAANRALDEQAAGERDRERRRRETESRRRQSEEERRTANRDALRRRQTLLTPVAVRAVESATGQRPWALPGDVEHAMGVTLIAAGRPYAVVCPIAGRITDEAAERLSDLTVYVASVPERDAIARRCRQDQRIVILHAEQAHG